MNTYFVFTDAPGAPVFVSGIFRDFRLASEFANKGSGFRTVRKLPLTKWNFGPLPTYSETEKI